MRLELRRLLLTAAVSLLCSSCLRWGYGPRRELGALDGDGGVFDAGLAYAAGSGGSAGSAGTTTSVAAGTGGQSGRASGGEGAGTLAAGSGGRAGASGTAGSVAGAGGAVDAGVLMDAGVDSGAGMSDAAAADGGLITYQGCPSRPGVLFCDDFETADPDFEHWSYDTKTNGTVTRTQALTHASSAWSLLAATTQVSSSSFGSEARKATYALGHTTSGHIWMRSYNLVPSSVNVNKQFSLMILSNTEPPYHGVEPRLIPGDIELNTTGADVVPSLMGPTPFPRNTWVCVELHVFVDPVNGFYECYFDSTLVSKSGPVNTLPFGGYGVAEVGIHYAPPSQADAQVFVDDVYIGFSRIPCED